MTVKKVVVVCIAFLLIAGIFSSTIGIEGSSNETLGDVPASFAGGSGTPDDPYMIYDVHDLQAMNENLTAHYALANDIDASETREWNWNETVGRYEGFEPIGETPFYPEYGIPFTGSLDGRNHTITGLYIERPYMNAIGLFGYIRRDGIIRNTYLVEVEVRGYRSVGSLVGTNFGGTVSNSYATGNVSGDSEIGGLVGYNWQGTVTNSYATVDVSGDSEIGGLVGSNDFGMLSNSYATGTVVGNQYVGGLVGDNRQDTVVSNSYATGVVNGNNHVGGLVGQNRGAISNSYATGHVRGNDNVGGFVGDHGFSIVVNSYSTGNVTRLYGAGEGIGGFSGRNFRGKIINCYSTGNVHYEGATDPVDKGFAGSVYTGGDYEMTGNFWDMETSGQTSTAGDATGKSTSEMQELDTFTAVNWFITDISHDTERDIRYRWNIVNGETYPLLNLVKLEPFGITNWHELDYIRTELDGEFYLANDLDRETQGYMYYNDPETKGWRPLGYGYLAHFTGIFDGHNRTISGLYINRPADDGVGLFGTVGYSGEVRNVGLFDAEVIGSFSVGGIVGLNFGTISNSYATGSVSGDWSVGGLVGWNRDGTVEYSYATGNVSGGSNVGGLVGYDYQGTVDNSYSTASVSGNSNVGGLMGHNGWGCIVSNCYATGNVNGKNNVGGLVGHFSGGTVSNSFYNIDSVLINDGHHITTGGIFNEQYEDWFNNGLYLNISDYNETLIPVDDYYEINSVDGLRDLLGFADRKGLIFRLASGIDLSTAPGLYVPYLASNFDGDNQIISNLHIDIPFTVGLGMFGRLSGSVRNVGVVNAYVSGGDAVGGLVGYGGTVSNSYATGVVSGNNNVGGLVGSSGTVSNSYANCVVSGNDYVGGLVGRNSGTVSNSYATGTVSGNGYVGGLVGENWEGMVIYSYSTGNVTGFSGLGGLVGYNRQRFGDSLVLHSYATGDVNGDDYLGGLVGYNLGTLSNTYATGSVHGNNYMGGLVGYHHDLYDGEISFSYATGAVNGTRYVGGLVGSSAGSVSNSFYDSYTTGQSDVGKGVPKTTMEMIDMNTFIAASWNITAVADHEHRDPAHVWNIVDRESYPFFSWQETMFVPTSHQLTLTIQGEGSIFPSEGIHNYHYKSEVTINATPDEGWKFSHWSGDLSEGQKESDKITIVMDSDKTITANFEQTYHTLSISVVGEGTTYPSSGNHTQPYGVTVNMTATPDVGWRFSHWSGDVPGGQKESDEITVVMDSDKTITANFEQTYHTLSISVVGEGTTYPPSGNHTQPYGVTVNMTATPDVGWRFSHWSGDVPGGQEESGEITIVIDGNKAITAHFEELIFLPADPVLLVNPVEGSAPMDVNITVGVSNTGLLDGSIDLIVDGEVVHTLVVPGNGTAEHTLTHNFTKVGIFEIVFGELSESVIVRDAVEEDNIGILPLMLLGVAVVTLLLVYFEMKRRAVSEDAQVREDEPELPTDEGEEQHTEVTDT